MPGPGTYGQGIEINKNGVYPLSTVQNSRAANWSPSKKRFIDLTKHKRDIPGPGNYHVSDYAGGQYLLSNFKSYGVRVYKPVTRNRSKRASDTPGPGTYRAPSDFGYLEMAKFRSGQSTMVG